MFNMEKISVRLNDFLLDFGKIILTFFVDKKMRKERTYLVLLSGINASNIMHNWNTAMQ